MAVIDVLIMLAGWCAQAAIGYIAVTIDHVGLWDAGGVI